MNEKKIVIKQSTSKQLLYVLLSIIMTATSVYVFSSSRLLFGIKYMNKIIGIAGIIFFGVGSIILLKGFINPKDILIIDQDGITDNSSNVSIGFVPWNEIKSVYLENIGNDDFISIDLENFEEKLEKLPLYKRKAINANLKLGYSPILINVHLTKYKPVEVLDIIRKYKDVYSS